MHNDLTRIDVKANCRVEDTYTLNIDYEVPYVDEVALIPEARALDVVRDSGYIGLSVRGNIEIQPSKTIQGYMRLDVSELPAELHRLSQSPLLLAFRGVERQRSLSADIRRFDDVAVPDSSIDAAVLTTLVTEDGMVVTRAVYDIRNSVRQFLRVTLDPNAEVWSAKVSGQVVKPGRDAVSGAVVIPLFKSVEVDRRLGSFPVEIVYMQRIEPARGLRHAVRLAAPGTDILAGEVLWDVMLPRSRSLYGCDGDLRWNTKSPSFAFESGQPSRPRPRTASKKERVHRLREGVERFFLGDINGPGITLAPDPGRYKGAPLPPAQVGTPPTAAMVSGVLPVDIDVPLDGARYSFERVLAPQGKPLYIELKTCPAWTGQGIAVLRDTCILVAGFIFVSFAGRTVLRVKKWTAIVVIVFLAGAACIAFQRFAPSMQLFACIGAACALLCFVAPVLRRLQFKELARMQPSAMGAQQEEVQSCPNTV
ncbi:MAG: hypothetical protein WC655_18090 [Candidatus Hydrogenedentales bacterium]|jgi:hypothetical protein